MNQRDGTNLYISHIYVLYGTAAAASVYGSPFLTVHHASAIVTVESSA